MVDLRLKTPGRCDEGAAYNAGDAAPATTTPLQLALATSASRGTRRSPATLPRPSPPSSACPRPPHRYTVLPGSLPRVVMRGKAIL